MIQELQPGKHDIFDDFFNIKIVPINKVGVCGAGLALEFKKRYPEWHKQYVKICSPEMVKIPAIFDGYIQSSIEGRCWIYNYFTKNHWKQNSNLELIEVGAQKLAQDIADNYIAWSNIGIPKVGCGLGGLDWNDVKPILDRELRETARHNNIYYLL